MWFKRNHPHCRFSQGRDPGFSEGFPPVLVAGSAKVASHSSGPRLEVTIMDPARWRSVRAQSAIDRFTSTAYDLVIEGESYRRVTGVRCPTVLLSVQRDR
jgi:hypothetical protein